MSLDRYRGPRIPHPETDWQKGYLYGRVILGILIIGIGGKATRDSGVQITQYTQGLELYRARSATLNSCELNIAKDLGTQLSVAQRNAALGILVSAIGFTLASTTRPHQRVLEKRKPHDRSRKGPNRHV